MSERRNFLKVASLIPLGMISGSPAAVAAAEATSTNLDDQASPAASGAPPVPPPPPPIQEQPFPNYHLKGKPDHDANLFGEARPQDFKATKEELENALNGAAAADDPIHEWLKTFESSFDARATNIVIAAAPYIYRPNKATELRYEPQLYDASLRSASILLDRCLRYRNEMGGYELAGIGAGISYLTFIKLKPLQRNFLIQSNSADLAEIERTTEWIASRKYNRADKGLDRLFEKYQLQAKEIEATGSAREAGLAEVKDNFLTELMEKQFHIQIDAQLAQFTRLLSPGSASNYAERYLRILAMLSDDLTDAYCKLYSAAKGVQQILNLAQVAAGTGSLIPVDIPTFSTAADVSAWVQKIIPAPGPVRQPDALDAMVLWTRAVMRELDRLSQYETEVTVAIPLNQLIGAKTAVLVPSLTNLFDPQKGVDITIDAGCLPFATPPTSLRVTAVGLSVEYSPDDFSPIQFMSGYPGDQPPTPTSVGVPPAISNKPTTSPNGGQVGFAQGIEQKKVGRLNAMLKSPPQSYPTGPTSTQSYERPPIFLSNVRMQGGTGGDLEPALSMDAAAHNLYPVGKWNLYMDANAIAFFPTGQNPANWIKGLILYLRLRGAAA